ncbi:MAG: lipoxygenase family protein [Pseudomonadota bacterium]|nr:lipoxygenase family protein [Pseudomonadota bacterium]
MDRLKISALLWVRGVNQTSIESWSRRTFRYRRALRSAMPSLLSAPHHYSSAVLPAGLMVPAKIPAESSLKMSYVAPYYILTGILFKFYLRFPLSRAVAWTKETGHRSAFPPHDEGWADIQTDEAFTALRVQGPNPFLLQKKGPDTFEVDFEPFTKGAFEPVCCTFVLRDGALAPATIRIGQQVHRPGDAGWERAKFVANSIDARFTVFLRHLAHTHLISGQSFALSAFALPPAHPLRPFLDFFTYSTLVVNDFAFKLLVTPASYFLQSNFIVGEQVGKMFENMIPHYRLEQLMPRRDIAERGIDAIPNHPYVEDGTDAWDVIHSFVGDFVRKTHPDDAAVRADAALAGWYRQLVTLLPDRSPETHPLDGLETLVETLSALVYLNVSHEVSGDFSPFIMSDSPQHRKLVSHESLVREDTTPASASDVFLFEQGAWAGRFEHAGNWLTKLNPEVETDDLSFRQSLTAFQGALGELEKRVVERNKARKIPFSRMLPSRWQASISY